MSAKLSKPQQALVDEMKSQPDMALIVSPGYGNKMYDVQLVAGSVYVRSISWKMWDALSEKGIVKSEDAGRVRSYKLV